VKNLKRWFIHPVKRVLNVPLAGVYKRKNNFLYLHLPVAKQKVFQIVPAVPEAAILREANLQTGS